MIPRMTKKNGTRRAGAAATTGSNKLGRSAMSRATCPDPTRTSHGLVPVRLGRRVASEQKILLLFPVDGSALISCRYRFSLSLSSVSFSHVVRSLSLSLRTIPVLTFSLLRFLPSN